jgi:hypothetical protein
MEEALEDADRSARLRMTKKGGRQQPHRLPFVLGIHALCFVPDAQAHAALHGIPSAMLFPYHCFSVPWVHAHVAPIFS